MSKEFECDSNNLCTTEDAFDHFSANSVYNEDEFVTLNDIVSPTYQEPETSSDIREIPYDNEVVVSSNFVQDKQNVNITTTSDNDADYDENTNTYSSGVPKEDENPSTSDIGSSEIVKSPSKRVRKKKSYYDDDEFSPYRRNAGGLRGRKANTTHTGNTLNSHQDSLTTTQKKRGRKPQNKSLKLIVEQSSIIDNKSVNESSDATTSPLNSNEKNLVMAMNSTVPQKRRPGRPKKTKQDLSVIKPDSTNDSLKGSSQDSNVNKELLNTAKKRGRKPKKKIENSLDNFDSEEIVTSENFSDTFNTDTELKDILEGKKPKRKSMPNKSTEISSTEKDDLELDKNISTLNKDDDSILNQLNEMFSDETNETGHLESALDISVENEHIVESSSAEDASRNLDTALPDINVSIHTKNDTINKTSLDEQSSLGQSIKETSNHNSIEEDIEVTTNPELNSTHSITDEEDDTEDICLSKLKESIDCNNTNIAKNDLTSYVNSLEQVPSIETDSNSIKESNLKRNVKMPVMEDFEYNIDSVLSDSAKKEDKEESLLVEDTSKRSIRKRKQMQYEVDSDEDPFANVELSDDDEPKRNRKGKYNSDDEYVPCMEKRKHVRSSDSGSDIFDIDENLQRLPKRKRNMKRSDSNSPRKRGKKNTETVEENEVLSTIYCDQDDDVDECLEPSVIKLNKNNSLSGWGTTNEFENFLAKKIANTNIKIKKCSDKQNKSITPLEIPVIDQNTPKKFVDVCSQTKNTETKNVSSQTNTVYDIPMKDNIILTSEQSEKACEFLNNVVTTTVELGRLMTEKSQDFIKKKINTTHVKDTMRMDYCVKKSFLLFKLAKHNLEQMEVDLAKQYEEFLKSNDLLKYRSEPKILEPTPVDDDSDCEIVEVPENTKSNKISAKSTFNPKTVFLNKELSIKIAKKPTESEQKIKIRGKNAIWISDSVMVKKVKPTQSFLAQDSRNKKPPDNFITAEMVNNFFINYYRQETIASIVNDFFNNYHNDSLIKVCNLLTSTNWLSVRNPYVCNYFVVTADLINEPSINELNAGGVVNREISPSSSISITSPNVNALKPMINNFKPESLLTLCTIKLQKYLFHTNKDITMRNNLDNEQSNRSLREPLSLFQLCICALSIDNNEMRVSTPNDFLDDFQTSMSSLSLCNTTIEENSNFEELMLNNPVSLFKLCVTVIIERFYAPMNQVICNDNTINIIKSPPVSTLKSICYEKIVTTYFNEELTDKFSLEDNYETNSCNSVVSYEETLLFEDEETDFPIHGNAKTIKTLATLCIEKIQNMLSITCSSKSRGCQKMLFNPSSLKSTTLNYFNNYNLDFELKESVMNSDLNGENFTIDCVNTLSEEAFHNLEHTTLNHIEYTDMDDEGSHDFDDDYHGDFENQEEQINTEETWLSQLQLQEPRTCVTPSTEPHTVKELETNIIPVITQVKLEPVEDICEPVDTSIVKSEPLHNLDEMTVIPENVFTKSELVNVPEGAGDLEHDRRGSASYDVDAFESFVQRNKMMQSINECNNEEIFTQSMFRVRRQFEPDYEDVNDLNNSLLIPQTFEKLPANAKDHLMQSSSDEGTISKKQVGKKKVEKRKTRVKRPETKANKETASSLKDKPLLSSDIAIMTRRMRDRIRQEEKKIESSDSEAEDKTLNTLKEKKIDKSNKGKESPLSKTKNVPNDRSPNNKLSKPKEITHEKRKNVPENEIQCNAVDSTEQLNETVHNETSDIDDGLASIASQGQNNTSEKNVVNDHFLSSMLDFSEPAEMVECEPSIPMFDDVGKARKPRRSVGSSKNKTDTITSDSKKDPMIRENPGNSNAEAEEPKTPIISEKINFTDRDGWHCYPINPNDKKLYLQSGIYLDKLPESFVETYFQYQVITEKSKEDQEVDRLTNLSSLGRGPSMKDGKHKSKHKGTEDAKISLKSEPEEVSRCASPAHSEHCAELTPSEDEGNNVDDEKQSSIPLAKQTTENCLAKNSLMDDNGSDTDTADEVNADEAFIKRRPGPKSKTRVLIKPKTEDLMLTADKMMNKELQLLHTPVVLKDGAPEAVAKISPTKPKQRISLRPERTMKERLQIQEDSSSEEEKQWVNTKEKLLKRMGKKEDVIADDAKRAKLVSEFIEKRGVPESRMRRKPVGRPRRSKKKLLERQKQFRVLSRELLGEPMESGGGGKTYSQAYSKGRRNIRKVIDKKSLATSTVIANMEEFERKRRLNAKQNRLREILGCEEGVNVLVINDEVCLEYDFAEERPVVTIHPFFTKVMKAHQYEGVKFMWDACFESLETIQSGHPGGGCILAHCMGLGKTLQVLALLHTVLTHPRVGMSRVLVCCPLSTVLNWVDEIHKWIGPVTNQIKVFELSKLRKTYERAFQLEDWYKGGGIFIIGYELFRSLTTLDPDFDDVRPTIIGKIRTALLDPGPDIIVCDEGHLLKNDCSVLAVAMSRVVTKRRIVLTGTPMQNNLREYYCMVNFVKPNLLGKYSEYSNRFENPIMNGQHRDSSEEDIKLMKARTHILHKVLEGCLQRQEASVLYPYLPKKHEYTVFIPLTKCQWDLYKHYIETYGRKSKQSILKDFHILQKIWSHPQVLHNFQMKSREEKNKIKLEKLEDDLAREDLVSEDMKPEETEVWWLNYLNDGTSLDSLESSNKFVAVFRILNECNALGDKVLIFSTSLFSLDGLEYFLKKINKWSLGQEYYRLDGSVPAEVRQNWCREFNAENNRVTKLFLISTRAGCLGLNMTAANRVIILDTSWNPAHDIQSIFRVYRFGQKKDCFIYRLVALGTMEQKIYERSVTKQAVACRVVDEQQIDRHYNMAELTELYRLDEAGASVAGGVAVGVADVALLRVARDAAVHAVHEHDSLLRGSGEQGLPEHERNAAWVQFQQEHAHKQMQNELQMKNDLMKTQQGLALQEKPKKGRKSKVANVKLALPPETSVEIKAETNVDAKVPEKTEGTVPQNVIDYKPSVPVDDSKKDADYVPRYSFREKKGRKFSSPAAAANTRPPAKVQEKIEQPPPHKAQQTIIDKGKILEEEMIQGITQILKQHQFKANNEPHKIMGLINNVKNLVFGGGFTSDDPLSQHIASFTIQRNFHSVPALTHFICEAISRSITEEINPAPAPALRKSARRSKRKQLVIDDVHNTRSTSAVQNAPSTSAVKPIIEITVSDAPRTRGGRNKKRAKAPPETKEESQKVIELDDDYNAGCVKPVVTITETSKAKERETVNMDESILLSDEDDTPIQATTTPQQKDASDKTRDGPKKPKAIAEQTKGEAKPASPEKIPLHPSLLTNAHFIKIVAHTYLDGNKMLDEDAAILAAQYSTSKTLQEYDRTGKSIVTGPIYDIAIEVLGTDFLKKVHLSNPKVQPVTPVEKPSLKMGDDAVSALVEAEKDPQPRVKPRPRSKRLKITSEPAKRAAAEAGCPPAPQTTPHLPTAYPAGSSHAAQRLAPQAYVGPAVRPPAMPQLIPSPQVPLGSNVVVPVGLFRTANAPAPPNLLQPSDSECILPDDDDVHIINDDPATAPPVNVATAENNFNFIQAIDQSPLLLGALPNVAPWQMATDATQQPAKKHTITISSGRIMDNAFPHESPKPPNPDWSTSDGAICLDSDDEESITPHIANPKQTRPPAAPKPPVTPILGSLRAVGPHGQMIPVLPPAPAAVPNASQPTKIYTLLKRPDDKTSPKPADGKKTKNLFRLTPDGQLMMDAWKNPVKVTVVQAETLLLPVQASTAPASAPATSQPVAAQASQTSGSSHTDEKAPVQERVRNQSSSSSNSSRSGSPYDPLSILKDVVQIRAAAEPSSKISTYVNKKVAEATKLTKISDELKKPTPSTSKSSSPALKSSTVTNYNVGPNIVRKIVQVESKKTQILLKKVESYNKSQSGNSNAAVKLTIDLTKTASSKSNGKTSTSNVVTEKKKPPDKKPDSVPVSGIKVVGTTKNLVFNGKSITTKDSASASTSKPASATSGSQADNKAITLKYPKVLPAQTLKVEKRRTSVLSPVSAPKKQKYNSTMTLEDFNLDDIDDIIELE